MAYVNVAEWSPEHVAEWLKGLEYSLLPYVHFFLNNEIDGSHLLNLTADDLEDLHIFKVGHQQLILEAVELLRQLHYSLTSETLQSLAVKLGCKARSLYNDLKLNGPQDHMQNTRQERVSTSVLSAVSEVLTSVKALVSWLDRLPFQRDSLCIKLKKTVLKLSIELASTTQRDQFAERPHSLIKRNSLHLAELCDKFVQDSKDSLILQPASLDIAMIKKKPDEELGIHIKSTYSGVHIIGGIKDQSPAKRCNKIEKGDEIIQVNYQTVIGWQQKKLVTAMTEHSSELHLTIKKRPRHVNILGEVIILRPYRIPSKKTANKCHKWSEDNQLRGQDTCSTSNESECMRDDFNEDEDDSAFLPADASAASHLLLAKDMPLHRRLLPGTSPAAVQRRATVSGASPTVSKPPVNIEDLVNGVPRIKNSETFGRSISHDPACHKLSLKQDAFHAEDSEVKTDNVNSLLSETCSKNVGSIDDKEVNSQKCSDVKDIGNEDSRNGETDDIVTDAIPLEECALSQSKSLSEVDDRSVAVTNESISGDFKSINNCNDAQNTDICSTNSTSSSSSLTVESTLNDVPIDKHSIVLYNWEGLDTEFCGRRPSAHDISNEIAGSNASNINSVLLRRASKLQTSLPLDDSPKDTREMGSYQIVIVGGVPQRCPPSFKESKDKACSLRKKDCSLGKFGNRRISCKDLGKGDCAGFLYKQKDKKGFFPSNHHWVKRWIVLKNQFLYTYRDENDSKAECLISLPGSHVSEAFDCKTKKYAFKVCQQRAKFYFATEYFEDRAKWLDKIRLSTISRESKAGTTSGFLKSDINLGVSSNFYSETDDSENESPIVARRAENALEMSTSSSSSELSYDYYLKGDKRTKITSSVNSRNPSTISVYPKIRKQYLNNKDMVSNWIKRKTQNNSEVRQNTSHTSEVSHVVEAYVSPKDDFIQSPNAKMYNRSFSCTETSYCHFKTDPNSLIRKMSYESSGDNNHVSLSHNVSSKIKTPQSHWNTMDEEYDMLTSSLGRQQKPLAKEITPGLVARMAVSYSNLTQKNASSSPSQSKKVTHKGIPAPGYVAKISDSFDHLAKMGNSGTFDAKGRKLQYTSSAVSEIANDAPSSNYKRSASESQVSKRFTDGNCRMESLNTSFSAESQIHSNIRGAKERSREKFVSLLDKEYNKVFEGKKVSQQQLKSYYKSNSNESGKSRREMRFFPSNDESNPTNTSANSKSNSIQSGKESSKYSSENLRNSINFRTWYDDSVKTHNFPPDLKKNQSYEIHTKKSATSTSYSTRTFCSHLNSSEGIENIGFSCVDQLSNDSFDSNISSPSKEDLEQRNCECSPNSICSLHTIHNLTVPNDTSDGSSPKSSFKFFNSPKFMKKLTSPKLDKKNIFKSKKQAKEKKAEQKEVTQLQNDKKFFGSPRLVRAIFGSPKSQKKTTVSSAVQTDQISFNELSTDTKKTFHDLNRNDSFVTTLEFTDNISSYVESHEQETAISKSSSNSSLNSNISNSLSPFTSSLYYVEARIKPQITISLPLVTDKKDAENKTPPETPRTPLKPTMGIAMLSKKRLPSLSGESSVSVSSSKSSHDGSIKEVNPLRSEVSMDINGDNEFLEALESLQNVDVSSENIDGNSSVSKSSEK